MGINICHNWITCRPQRAYIYAQGDPYLTRAAETRVGGSWDLFSGKLAMLACSILSKIDEDAEDDFEGYMDEEELC